SLMRKDAPMPTIAMTGCASRFAQALLPRLEADPSVERVIGLDLTAPTASYTKLEFHQADIRDGGIGERLRGCDALIHLAFVVGQPYAMSYAEAADINLRGTWNVCRAAAEAGVRKLVISSSIAAYGILPDNPNPLREEHPLRGLYNEFYYSQHKHANEIWLDGLQLQYPQLIISRLRPCVVMGPHQFAAAALQIQGEHYLTTASGRVTPTQYVHEDDLAAAFQLMLTRDLPGAYNVVADAPETPARMAEAAGLTVLEVPRELFIEGATQAWRAGLSAFGPEWVGGTEAALLCANARLKAAGWAPRYTTTEAFVETVRALRGS
ncbi:MAG TPA: NAD-dependent epimerase/dehydratase family protein, partial [Ktedonobacterales bacterium]